MLLPARRLRRAWDREPFEQRKETLREALSLKTSAAKLLSWPAKGLCGQLLLALLWDSEPGLRARALELYLRRAYRGCGVSASSHLRVATKGCGQLAALWHFRYPGVAQGGMQVWRSLAKVLPHLRALKECLGAERLAFEEKEMAEKGPGKAFRHPSQASWPGRLHLIVLDSLDLDEDSEKARNTIDLEVHHNLRAVEAKLTALGISEAPPKSLSEA